MYMSSTNPTNTSTSATVILDPFKIAAGLIRNDATLFIPLLLVLAFPTFLGLYASSIGVSWWTGLMVFDRLVQIGVVTYIALRWRRKLAANKRANVAPIVTASRVAAVSLASSFVMLMPLNMFALTLNSGLEFLFLALFFVGCVWCLRVLFYFTTVSVFGMEVRQGLAASTEVARRNPMMALKSLVSPTAFTVLFVGLSLVPAPDGRSIVWTTIASIMEGVFWIGSTYTALGCALAFFDDQAWRAAGLDPYRSERLSTLQTQGGAKFGRLLAPRAGIVTLVIGLMFVMGNLARQLTLPPSAVVSLESVNIGDRTIQLKLNVEDHEYHFRGFNITAFSIASKTGFTQSEKLLSASLRPDGAETLSEIPTNSGDPRSVYLTFATNKSAEALRAADNLWLWYKAVPLMPISDQAKSSK